jgi:hypothetical protein
LQFVLQLNDEIITVGNSRWSCMARNLMSWVYLCAGCQAVSSVMELLYGATVFRSLVQDTKPDDAVPGLAV